MEMQPPAPRSLDREKEREPPAIGLVPELVLKAVPSFFPAFRWRMCVVAVEGGSSCASRNLD